MAVSGVPDMSQHGLHVHATWSWSYTGDLLLYQICLSPQANPIVSNKQRTHQICSSILALQPSS